MTSKVIYVMLAGTLLLQGAILYKQTRPAGTPPAERIVTVKDRTVLDIGGMPNMGGSNASIVLIEFSDFECPFCRQHAGEVFSEIRRSMIDTGTIRYVFANLPLPIHRNATELARAAICAGHENKYWAMHDRLFAKPVSSKEELLAVATEIVSDPLALGRCVEASEEANSRLTKDMAEAQKLDLRGTPSFAVGRISDGTTVVVEKIIKGAMPFNVFAEVINGMR